MVYLFNKKNYKDFKTIFDNIQDKRSYFIPYKTKEKLINTDFRKERYKSDIVTVLSGEWDFRFYKDCRKVPEKLDTEKTTFDKIKVPSVWQRTGYQNPVYLNCPYEFKTMFPDVPEDMAAGVYRKKFTVDTTDKTYILTFLGVATNLELYVNGVYAGYSEGSHNTSEFNISDLIKKGENEIVVLSYKWCCGSFLEAQDMFRENGIFRDVLLSAYDDAYIYDYHFTNEKTDKKYNTKCKINLRGNITDCTVKTELCEYSYLNEFIKNKVIASSENKAEEFINIDYGNLKVNEWNAEEPFTYALYITLFDKDGKEIMTARQIVGFKTIETDKDLFKFNSRLIKFKGVNHHDTHPVRGYCLTEEDYEKDVKLMKEFNVNAVRTSHYPPDPIMLSLASFYGLYVIDEADIETHGLDELCRNIDAISDNPKWEKHYLDRVSRMYERDKNQVCVTMWSLGNEAGGIKNQVACYNYLKSTGSKIPVHYEAACRSKICGFDVISHMYTDIESCEKIGQHKYGTSKNKKQIYASKPFYQCEYAHAMGVGPGSLEDYWQTYYKYDNLTGGCIWEWADHSVYHGSEDTKYKYEYTYGGDHKEKQHDGNFCVDGLFYPDRTPHTGAYQMKNVYRPLRIKHIGGNKFELTNTNRFRFSDYIKILWTQEENGVAIKNGELILTVAPTETETFDIPLNKYNENKDCIVTFRYIDVLSGRKIAFEQTVINDVPAEYKKSENGKLGVEYDKNILTVSFANGFAKFNEETGEMLSYNVNGCEFLNQSPVDGKFGFLPNVYRAPLDNDRNYRIKWTKLGLDNIKTDKKYFYVNLSKDCVSIGIEFDLKGKNKVLYTNELYYDIYPDGTIDISTQLEKQTDNEVLLPRFGLMGELNASFDCVEYYGRGLHENLPDMTVQSPIGIFEEKVSNMHEKCIYPQDNSNHGDVKYITLSNGKNKLNIVANYNNEKINENLNKKLSFSAHDYTQKNLDKAKHQEDIVRVKSTVLCIDGFVRGSGTNSCGPHPLEKYTIDKDMLSFAFSIKGE